MSKTISPYGNEPSGITPDGNYNSKLSVAFNWYNQEKDKKDARTFLRNYILSTNKSAVKVFDRVSDSHIINTYGWLSRLLTTGSTLREDHVKRLNDYINRLLLIKSEPVVEKEQVKKPSVRDNMEEKVREYLGNLEGVLDDMQEFDLYKDLSGKQIPAPYVPFIHAFVLRKASEFINVYETDDKIVREGYSNIGKRKLTYILKTLNSWKDDLERYGQFKKANRKPRAKKTKSPIEQVKNIKYCKEFPELNLKSVNPVELIGCSQAWLYNIKYKRLSVYRTESSQGIQVKGTTLQNYDPDTCEQKTLRKPQEVIQQVLTTGKVNLRKVISSLSTKDIPVNGRISEDVLILRVLK